MKQKLSLKQASSLLRSIATGRMTDLPAIQKACRNVNELLVQMDHAEKTPQWLPPTNPRQLTPATAPLGSPPERPANAPPVVMGKRKPGRPRKIALPPETGGML